MTNKRLTLTLLLLVSGQSFSADSYFPSDDEIKQEQAKTQRFIIEHKSGANSQSNRRLDQETKEVTQQAKEVFSSVEVAENNFPKVDFNSGAGIDIEAIANRYAQRVKASENVDGLMVFASFSMPAQTLKKLAEDSAKVGGALVFRGFKDGSYKRTAEALQALGNTNANVQINPEAFTKYKVAIVPSMALLNAHTENQLDNEGCALPDRFSKVTGDVSVQFALEHIQRNEPSQEFKSMASRLLIQLKGTN